MTEKKRIPFDREIVERFIKHLRDDGHPDLKIDSWPEDDHPGQSAVEAIAGNLAIEHTSVDILFYQLYGKRKYYPTLRDEEAVNPDGSALR